MVEKHTPEYLQEFYKKYTEKQKGYKQKRQERYKQVTVEISRYAAHTLRVLADERGVGMGRVLTKMLEHEARQRGLELPKDPMPASQVVTPEIHEAAQNKPEAQKIDIRKTLDIWDEE